MDEVDIERRLARIEARLVQLMLYMGMAQRKDGQIEKIDTYGTFFALLREHDRDTGADTPRPEDGQGD